MNLVVLQGNLARDPEARTAANGTAVVKFSVACDLGKDKNGRDLGAEFVNCVCFDKRGELLAKYFRKGQKILIEGRIHTESWEKDGEKRTSTGVVVQRWEFCGGKTGAGTQSAGGEEVGDIPF